LAEHLSGPLSRLLRQEATASGTPSVRLPPIASASVSFKSMARCSAMATVTLE
jgi:hypothetical protein